MSDSLRQASGVGARSGAESGPRGRFPCAQQPFLQSAEALRWTEAVTMTPQDAAFWMAKRAFRIEVEPVPSQPGGE